MLDVEHEHPLRADIPKNEGHQSLGSYQFMFIWQSRHDTAVSPSSILSDDASRHTDPFVGSSAAMSGASGPTRAPAAEDKRWPISNRSLCTSGWRRAARRMASAQASRFSKSAGLIPWV